jgi:3-phenylpropionate/trans-cinnamate dioxygenase ferredoxin reductase subunit
VTRLREPHDYRRIVVVGAGLAGVSSARALRAQGFDGELVLLGDEPHQPYDRPPLSKELLAGAFGVGEIALLGPDDAELDLDLRLNVEVTGLDVGARELALGGGARLGYDGLVLACGARARTLPVQRRPAAPTRGVHTLRTLDDAMRLRADLAPGARLVVVGGGFLGAEVASTARDLGAEVTVLEATATPLAAVFGSEAGSWCAGLHARHGVRLLTDAVVTDLVSAGSVGAGSVGAGSVGAGSVGAGSVSAGSVGGPEIRAVELADGRRLEADVVVVAVGAVPAVGWLRGSALRLEGGIVTGDSGLTDVPGIVAVGDCAARPDRLTGRPLAGQHWTEALERPVLAAAALLGRPPPPRPAVAEVPYVWSHQYGVMIQFAGRRLPGDVMEVVDGDPASSSFAAVLRGKASESAAGDPSVHAVLAVDRPRSFTRLRRALARNAVDGASYGG